MNLGAPTVVELSPSPLSFPLSLLLSSQEKAAISHALESRISVLRTELQESKAQLQVTSQELSLQTLPLKFSAKLRSLLHVGRIAYTV